MKRRSGENFETSRSHFMCYVVLVAFSANHVVYAAPLEGVKPEESIVNTHQLQPPVINTGFKNTLSQVDNKPVTKVTVEDISTLLSEKKDENKIFSNKKGKSMDSTNEVSTDHLLKSAGSDDSVHEKSAASTLLPEKPSLPDGKENYKLIAVATPVASKGSQLSDSLPENHLSDLKTEQTAEKTVPQSENLSLTEQIGQKINTSTEYSEKDKAESSSTKNVHEENHKVNNADAAEESMKEPSAKNISYFTKAATSINSPSNLSQILRKSASPDEPSKVSDMKPSSDTKKIQADTASAVSGIKHETDEDAELTVGAGETHSEQRLQSSSSKVRRPMITKQANTNSENKLQIPIAVKSHETEVHAEMAASTLTGFQGIALEYLLMVLCVILIVILLIWRRFWYTVCTTCCPRSYQSPNTAYKAGYRPLNRD